MEGLEPIIKWAGGKEKELKYIIPALPPAYRNYYEPFVGGGAVFAAVNAEHYHINDLSSELISLYRNIAESSRRFFSCAEAIDRSWERAHNFFEDNRLPLKERYLSYRDDEMSRDALKSFVADFCNEKSDDIQAIVGTDIRFDRQVFMKEMHDNLLRKMTRMKVLEQKKDVLLPDGDVGDNIETAVKSALYMCYRDEYNRLARTGEDREYYSALFLFIRNYCYSGMFRYNDKGSFNVPYGGIAYNGKGMSRKLDYYRSEALLDKLADTDIYNMDFEDFLNEAAPGEDDFVFLDPPYDTEFSTYARNEFTRDDQRRLADYMTGRCRAKWMLVIKNTDFIFSLYDRPGINIMAFDKKYLVSFMNRNARDVTHLIIKNY